MSTTTQPWERVRVDDVDIEYTERGRGEPVFLVHAGVFSDWFKLVYEREELDDFRVISVRRAGYGQSRPRRHLTLHDHATHVAAVAEQLELEQLHWVGHSSSCLIGLSLAAQRPELVRSLVLMEPSAAGAFEVPASVNATFVGRAMEEFHAGQLANAFDTFMRAVSGDDYRRILERSLGKDGLEDAIRESEFFFRDEVPAIREWTLSPAEAARVRQPVLCIQGGAQPTHLTEMSRQISERVVQFFPQAQVLILPGVHHAMPLQDPAAVAAAASSFITQHRSRQEKLPGRLPRPSAAP